MVNVAMVAKALGRLTLMKYFPADDVGRSALVEIICEMVHDEKAEEQAEWLARRMMQVYREWPGPYEMRACFCGRYKPKDGIIAYSEIYPDGFPPDPTAPPRPGIAGPSLSALPPGRIVTADPELDASVQEAAKKRGTPPMAPLATRFAQQLRDVVTNPPERQGPERPINLDFKPITQEDIERAVAEHRRKKAQEGGNESPTA